MGYNFPPEWPKGCPPEPHDEKCGQYYRIVRTTDKLDPNHFKSQHEEKIMLQKEETEGCSRRAVSIISTFDGAANMLRSHPQLIKKLGCFVAKLDLIGGHGVVHEDKDNKWQGHHDWWVPIGVNPNDFCTNISEVVL
jgi:hypothetical protein